MKITKGDRLVFTKEFEYGVCSDYFIKEEHARYGGVLDDDGKRIVIKSGTECVVYGINTLGNVYLAFEKKFILDFVDFDSIKGIRRIV